MNQGRIWRVVKPSVGVPLFLGGVATIALLVHGAILLNTDWFATYWNGGQLPTRVSSVAATKTAEAPTPPPTVATAPAAAPEVAAPAAPAVSR